MSNETSAIFQCISFHIHECKDLECTASTDALEEFDRLCAAESRAEQLECELATARADIVRYQDSNVALLGRIEALAAELQEQEPSDNPYILHGEELKRATEARIAGRP